MTTTLELDVDKLNRPWTRDLSGTRVSVQPSPFDVPKAIQFHETRGSWLRPRQYVIKFKYLATEPLRGERLGEGVTVSVGKSSRRVYALSLEPKLIPDAFKGSAKAFSGWLAEAIANYSSKHADRLRERNHKLAQEALVQAGIPLFELVKAERRSLRDRPRPERGQGVDKKHPGRAGTGRS